MGITTVESSNMQIRRALCAIVIEILSEIAVVCFFVFFSIPNTECRWELPDSTTTDGENRS